MSWCPPKSLVRDNFGSTASPPALSPLVPQNLGRPEGASARGILGLCFLCVHPNGLLVVLYLMMPREGLAVSEQPSAVPRLPLAGFFSSSLCYHRNHRGSALAPCTGLVVAAFLTVPNILQGREHHTLGARHYFCTKEGFKSV